MARPTNAALAAKAEAQAADAAPAELPRVIYRPREEDSSVTVWNRHRFEAGIPVTLKDMRNGYTAKEMLALARNNPFFEIEGEGRKLRAVVSEPTTAEQYRAYAANWIRDAKTSKGLVSRWESEEELRADCGVGTDDIEFIGTLFNPRKATLVKVEKAAAAMVEA